MIAQHAVDLIGEDVKVVYMGGTAGDSTVIDRLKGIKNILDKYPKAKIVSEQYTATGAGEEARVIMQNLLTANPSGSIDAVLTYADNLAEPILKVCENEGRIWPLET
jgi:ABC-type sugar transport system substrate-binding protein